MPPKFDLKKLQASADTRVAVAPQPTPPVESSRPHTSDPLNADVLGSAEYDGGNPELGGRVAKKLKKDGERKVRSKNWLPQELPFLAQAGLSVNLDPRSGADNKLR